MCPCFGTFSGKGDVGRSDRGRDVCCVINVNVQSDDTLDLTEGLLRVSVSLPHFFL